MFKKFEIILFLLFSLITQTHAGECQSQLHYLIAKRLNNTSYLDRIIPRYSFVKNKILDSHMKLAVQKALYKIEKNIQIDLSEEFNLPDTLNTVAQKIRENNNHPLEAAEKMAKFAEEIRTEPTLRNLDEFKNIDLLLALAVGRLEAFKKNDYLLDQDFILTTSPKSEIRPEQYQTWVESYLLKTDLYSKALPGKVLSSHDYRDLTSHNHWPIYLKDHDIRHIHYSLSHPRAMAVLLTAMRSTNAKRVILLSGLFEGVDRVQFYYETKLCEYFSKQRAMNLEEAMLHIARASEAELKLISEQAGIDIQVTSSASELLNWRPKLGGKFSNLGPKDKKYDIEIDEMLEDFTRLRKNDNGELSRRILEYTTVPNSNLLPISETESNRINY